MLTRADAAVYREMFPDVADRVQVIRNPAPWPRSAPAGPRDEVIVAAGHLSPRKGFDRLILAYQEVARMRPSWRLQIYGSGPERDNLQTLITGLGLQGRVRLMGVSHEFDRVLDRAAIFVLASRNEGLPMVIVEAMSKGVPVVSFRCPHGPAEMVRHGETGLLVEDGDLSGLERALLQLIDAPRRRRRMSRRALDAAEAYDADTVVDQWRRLIDDGAAALGPLDQARRRRWASIALSYS